MNTYQQRTEQLQGELQRVGLDGCVMLPGANFAYYSGQFKFVDLLTTILVIPATGSPIADRPVFLLPGFEKYTMELAMPYPADYITYERNIDGYKTGFAALAKQMDLSNRRIGIESTGMRFQEAEALRTAVATVSLEPIDGILAGIRATKSAEEIEILRQAARITEAALDATITDIRPGMTEIELRNRFNLEMLKAGAEGPGFDSLVVSGPRGVLQHAAPSDRAIVPGDPFLLDVGARHRGYTADITRTFVLGPVSDEFAAIYRIVREANAAGRGAAVPGATAEEVDQAARSVIERAGYAEMFIHGTGHGIGLDVHEPPRIAPGDNTILRPGMVFTIEPGIYVTEKFGVRIEDDIAITESGNDQLSIFSRDLMVL